MAGCILLPSNTATQKLGAVTGGREPFAKNREDFSPGLLVRCGDLHCRSLVSMSSSRHRKTTSSRRQATRTQLKPALSRHTCHSATLWPQHGFSQLDLYGETQSTGKVDLVDLFYYMSLSSVNVISTLGGHSTSILLPFNIPQSALACSLAAATKINLP